MLQGFSGFANMWEMDENNHLNVQFFVDWFHQALEIEAHALGHGLSAAEAQGSSLRGVEDQVVFAAEIRGAEQISIDSIVLEVAEHHLTLLHIMRNESTGAIAGTDTQKVCLVGADDFTPLPLTEAIKTEAAKHLSTPDDGLPLPRPLKRLEDRAPPSGMNAEKIGLFRNGASVVAAHEIDRTGRMRARYAMGRGSDSAARMWRNVGIPLDDLLARNMGTVVMQILMTHHNAPRLGTPLITYGGLVEVGNTTLQFAQWITDAETGEVYTSSDTIAVQFDHEKRKSVKVSDDQRADLQANTLKLDS